MTKKKQMYITQNSQMTNKLIITNHLNQIQTMALLVNIPIAIKNKTGIITLNSVVLLTQYSWTEKDQLSILIDEHTFNQFIDHCVANDNNSDFVFQQLCESTRPIAIIQPKDLIKPAELINDYELCNSVTLFESIFMKNTSEVLSQFIR